MGAVGVDAQRHTLRRVQPDLAQEDVLPFVVVDAGLKRLIDGVIAPVLGDAGSVL